MSPLFQIYTVPRRMKFLLPFRYFCIFLIRSYTVCLLVSSFSLQWQINFKLSVKVYNFPNSNTACHFRCCTIFWYTAAFCFTQNTKHTLKSISHQNIQKKKSYYVRLVGTFLERRGKIEISKVWQDRASMVEREWCNSPVRVITAMSDRQNLMELDIRARVTSKNGGVPVQPSLPRVEGEAHVTHTHIWGQEI